MKKYQIAHVAEAPRTELHDLLGLTGAEISINEMPAGAAVPFVHSHKENEEIYAVLSGSGTMTLDGEVVELTAGDWLRVGTGVRRQLAAASDSPIAYLCIQVREGSLQHWTGSDATIG